MLAHLAVLPLLFSEKLLHVSLHKRILVESAEAVFVTVPYLDKGIGFAAKLSVQGFGFGSEAEKAALRVADGG